MLLKAFAKINWSLDIIGVRPDGYHLMDMVMQPVSVADDISLTRDRDITIFTDGFPHSRADASNLAWRAAELLRSSYGIRSGVHISLHKRIPMGAGLGGGSADAAAVLYGLNRMWNLGIPPAELESIGLKLGADVPFCLRGGLVRTGGIGEIMENRDCKANFWMILIQPCRALSTREIFAAWKATESRLHPDTENVLHALSAGNSQLLASSIANVLEPVSASICPEIREAVEAMVAEGAFLAQMTGSGSAVFGAFRSRTLAEKAYVSLSCRYRTIHLCHTQNDSIRVMEE